MSTSMRKCNLAMILAVVAGVFALTSTFASAADELRLGLLVPKSGAGTDWGRRQEVAAKMAVDEINAKGGVNGARLNLVVMDTASQPDQAVLTTRKLAQDEEVLAIMGPFFSGECEAAFPQAVRLMVPIITASSGKPGVAENNRPWAFRNALMDLDHLRPGVKKFSSMYKLQGKSVAIVVDMKDAWAKNLGTNLLSKVLSEVNVKVMNSNDLVTFNTGDTDFTAQVTKLKRMKPDGIALAALYGEAGGLALEMKRQGLNVPVFGASGIFAAALIQRAGDAVEGWVATSAFWPQKPDVKVKQFVTDFAAHASAAKLGVVSPDHFTAAMYSNIYITAKIIQDRKITPKTPLKDARLDIRKGWETLKDYPAVDGSTSMTLNGDAVKTPYVLYVKGGQFVAAGQ